MKKMDLSTAYTRFLELSLHYSNRNAVLDELALFFDGTQWESNPSEDELDADEEVRVTLNYARKSVLWHVGLLTGKPPRVDVPNSPKPDAAARNRERYLRALLASVDFRRAYRRIEVSANKYGYGVLQALWTPGEAEEVEMAKAENSQVATAKKVYHQQPFTMRALDPRHFYPCYKTFDKPDDMLYAFRFDPDRLVEDIEDQYDVVLVPTEVVSGSRGSCDLIEMWSDTQYLLFAITTTMEVDESGALVAVSKPTILKDESHSYGRPPFFVLLNFIADPDSDPTDGGSLSEVALVKDTNKHLNLIVTLMATEIATRIHPPAVYTTDEPQTDVKAIRMGAGEVITIGAEETLEAMDWSGVPQTVSEHRDAIMQALRDFSGLPNTSLGSTGAGTSGIGMRLAYAVLEMILPLKLPERVEWLQDVLSHMLRVTHKHLGEHDSIAFWATPKLQAQIMKADISKDFYCSVKFGNLIPRNRIEEEQHITYLHKTGLISLRTALEMLEDVVDPDAEIERIRIEHKDAILDPETAAAIEGAKQAGQPPPPQPAGPAPTGLKNDAAPPVPQMPSMPTQQNAPFLERGQTPNLSPSRPGVNVGPPEENQI